MSIEAALAENTAALNRVAQLLEESNAGRAEAIAAAKAATEGASTRRRAPKTDTPAEPAPAASAAPTAPAVPSVEDVRAAFGTFLSVTDEAVKATRKSQVQQIIAFFGDDIPANEQGKRLIANVVEGQRAQAIAMVSAFGRGETPPELAAPVQEEEDEIG